MPGEMLSFKASKQLQDRVTELSEARGLNRSATIRAAVMEATARTGEDPVPDEAEVLALLGEAARGGNVTAMKELRVYHRERNRDAEAANPLDVIDELAGRRSA